MLIHIVSSGDTLFKLAQRYAVTAQAIAETNALSDPGRLTVGEALVIPTEDMYYAVQSGDTVWSIAEALGTTVEAVLRRNPGINPNGLYPGQVLYIPAIHYTVSTANTLRDITQRYGVSYERLLEVNGISNPSLIQPGNTLVIPLNKHRPAIDVNGYIYVFGESAVPIVTQVGDGLTYLAPFAYLIHENGSLEPIDDSPAIRAAYSEKIVPMMCVTNFTATARGENLAHTVLASPQIVDRLLDNIVSVMKDKGYLALNIDFENVLPADRELYNSFLQQAVDRLHPLGFLVSSALAPKYSAAQGGPLYEAHDYAAHGRILDFVVLMTYEWGWRGASPQAISPIGNIERVLDYAITVIPRQKIFYGFQIYARDWLIPHVSGQRADTFSVLEARELAVRHSAEIQYDTQAEAPFFRYTDEQGRMHEVWFEDARSAQAKFNDVKAYGVRGISYWALGYPFPQNWALLGDNFTINKRI